MWWGLLEYFCSLFVYLFIGSGFYFIQLWPAWNLFCQPDSLELTEICLCLPHGCWDSRPGPPCHMLVFIVAGCCLKLVNKKKVVVVQKGLSNLISQAVLCQRFGSQVKACSLRLLIDFSVMIIFGLVGFVLLVDSARLLLWHGNCIDSAFGCNCCHLQLCHLYLSIGSLDIVLPSVICVPHFQLQLEQVEHSVHAKVCCTNEGSAFPRQCPFCSNWGLDRFWQETLTLHATVRKSWLQVVWFDSCHSCLPADTFVRSCDFYSRFPPLEVEIKDSSLFTDWNDNACS